MVLFALTGITLNHAGNIESKPRVTTQSGVLPEALRTLLNAAAPRTEDGATRARTGAKVSMALPDAVGTWIDSELHVRVPEGGVEWSPGEIYIALPRPGGDAFMTVDMGSGEVNYERTDRGWIAYFNDLHKARHTGTAWLLFLDLFASACLVFCVTGLVLLQMHARNRPTTWPMVGLGLVLPLVLVILFIH